MKNGEFFFWFVWLSFGAIGLVHYFIQVHANWQPYGMALSVLCLGHLIGCRWPVSNRK